MSTTKITKIKKIVKSENEPKPEKAAPPLVMRGNDEIKLLDDFIKKAYKEQRDFTKQMKHLMYNYVNNQ